MNEFYDKYSVYVKVDENRNIVAINSDAFMNPTEEWIKIAEGNTDKYHHAQNNYLAKSLQTETGICRYRLIDTTPIEKTANIIAAEEAMMPPTPPTYEERIYNLETTVSQLL